VLGAFGACTAFDAGDSPSTPVTPTNDAAPDPDSGVTESIPSEPEIPISDAGVDVVTAPPPTCNAIVNDSFERNAPQSDDWNPSRQGGGDMSMELNGFNGTKHLLTKATENVDGSLAFLRRPFTVAGGKGWTGCLSFKMRVNQVPTGSVGGPRLMMWDTDTAEHQRLSVVVRANTILLEQVSSGACPPGGTCTNTSVPISKTPLNEWHTYVLTFSVDDPATRSTPPYGTWSMWVDDMKFSADLSVALGAPPKKELRMGIANTRATTELSFDDVVFDH